MTKKLRVLCTLLLCMIASVGWGDEVTFTSGTDLGGNSASGNPDEMTKSGIIISGTDAAFATAEYRFYSSSSLTVSSNNAKITKIIFTCTAKKGAQKYGPDQLSVNDHVGTYTTETGSYEGVWKGTAESVSFSVSAQCRATKIVVIYEAITPAYTITAVSNNDLYGTVSLTGTTITATPAEGYTYADPAYSVSPENSATVVQEGHAFSVTPSANTTVTINFEAIPTYTVTLGDDNSTLTETIGGAGVTLPSRSALNGYDFAGWSATNVSTETTTAPTIIPAGSYTPTANITLYPIYTKTGGGTTPSAFSVGNTGNYAIVSAEQSGKYYALPTSPTVSSGKITAQEITVSVSNGVKYITTANAEGFTWTIASATNGYTLSDGSNYIYHSNGGASGTNLAYGVNTSYTWAFTADDDYVTMAGMNGSTTNNRGLLFSGTTIGGYALSNANSSGYYKVMILPISAGSTTYYWSAPVAAAVEIPSIAIAENPFFFSTTATITCATEGAAIKYSFDGENWSDYSSALTITETKTIYAKAIKGENESAVAQLTATKNLAMPTVTVSGDLTLDLDGKTDVNAGTLTAAVTYNDAAVDGAIVTWSSSDSDVATIDASTGAVTIKTPGSVTFTATYAGNSDYAEVTATKTVTVIDNNAPGSEGNPYTVAQAIAYINTLGNSISANEVYVSGIISQVDSYSSQYNSITYWISDDGTTTNQMEVYSGKGLNGADFTAVTDLAVRYKVTVKGKVKMYSGTPEFDKSNMIVSLIRPKHNVTFYQNGTKLSEATVEEGTAIEFPTAEGTIYGKQFVGWLSDEIVGTTNEASPLTTATMGNADVTYYAVYANVTPGTSEEVTDVLTREITGVTGTSYTEWSEKTAISNAVYAGQSAGGNESIQLRSKDSNSGVITTVSGGKLKKVVVVWNNGTESGRTLDVYGSNTAYGSAADLYAANTQGTKLGSIVYDGTSTELTITGDYAFIGLRSNNGALYLDNITITWVSGTPATYSGYCTTVVAPVKPAKPIVFHDSGTYEGSVKVSMTAPEGVDIYYTLSTTRNTEGTKYTTPITISETSTLTAWAVQDGVESEKVTREYTIVEKAKGAVVEDGYYTIQNNDGKYMNVAGRKTVTLVEDTKSAGTVIRVKADEDGVKVLRSQAVDLPRYAERAMSYVPEIVKEVVKKLAANVDDPIIGEQGAELILDKFNQEFDYHLYLEGENNTYRIYGRTPSMKPVVDFYAENKELVDSRLPRVEDFVKEVLQKVVDKVGHGQSVVDMFKVKTVWTNMGGTLTDPDVDQAKFFEEVLSSEKNTWEFAYQTGMLYWDKVKSYLEDNTSELGDYGKYIEKIPQIRPNFKYYIVPSTSGVDIISEGNSEIADASTAWTLTKRDGFDVTFDASLSKNNGKEMYKTLYVDFAYELPENVKAYAITGINETTGFATKEEITGVIAAQTPVLLQATFDAEQTADQTMTLTLSTKAGTTPETNLLVGADYLINEYEINTPQVESIFSMLAKLSQSLANEYSYLKRKNAGTVNNKYFFGIAVEGELDKAYKEKTGDDMENTPVRILSMGNQKLGFYGSWDPVKNNEAFIVTENEELDPVKLIMKGDVYRDGVIDEKDLTALVEIVLGKVTIENKPDNYDFDAAYVNDDEYINIADVTALVNILNE